MENADKVYATVKGISDETTVSKVYYLSTEGLNSTHIGTALNYGQLNGEKAKYAGNWEINSQRLQAEITHMRTILWDRVLPTIHSLNLKN